MALIGTVTLAAILLQPANSRNGGIKPYAHPNPAKAAFYTHLFPPTAIAQVYFGGGSVPRQQVWHVRPQLTPVVAHKIIKLLGDGTPLRVRLPVPHQPNSEQVPYYAILQITNGHTVDLVAATHNPWDHIKIPLQQVPGLVTYTGQDGRTTWFKDPQLYEWLIHKNWRKYLLE